MWVDAVGRTHVHHGNFTRHIDLRKIIVSAIFCRDTIADINRFSVYKTRRSTYGNRIEIFVTL